MRIKLGGMNVEFAEIGSHSERTSLLDMDTMELPYEATFTGWYSFAKISGLACRGEIVDWLLAVESLYADPTKKVQLAFYEPTFSVLLNGHKTGQIQMICEVSQDEEREMHKFIFDIDQSYLPEVIQVLRNFLSNTR